MLLRKVVIHTTMAVTHTTMVTMTSLPSLLIGVLLLLLAGTLLLLPLVGILPHLLKTVMPVVGAVLHPLLKNLLLVVDGDQALLLLLLLLEVGEVTLKNNPLLLVDGDQALLPKNNLHLLLADGVQARPPLKHNPHLLLMDGEMPLLLLLAMVGEMLLPNLAPSDGTNSQAKL
jgi:hypothetical protein